MEGRVHYPHGGHVEEGETEKEALVREIQEELDILIEPLEKIAETKGDVPDQMTSWWRCVHKSGALNIRDGEIKDARYVTKEQMDQLPVWPATKDFFLRYIFSQ